MKKYTNTSILSFTSASKSSSKYIEILDNQLAEDNLKKYSLKRKIVNE